MKSLYKILGIKRSATNEEIKKAYYELAKLYHPDIPITGDEDRFKRIKDAYETLIDNDKRSVYDKTGISPGSNEETIYSIVVEMFKKSIWEDINEVKALNLNILKEDLQAEIEGLSKDIEKIENLIQTISEYNGRIYRTQNKRVVKIDCFDKAVKHIDTELNDRHKQLLSALSLKKKLLKILNDYEQKKIKYEMTNKRKFEDDKLFTEFRNRRGTTFVDIFEHIVNDKRRGNIRY